MLNENVVTSETLNKIKEQFSDQFNLDFNELLRVYIWHEQNKAPAPLKNKEAKIFKPKESDAAKKRKRMLKYALSVSKNEKEPLEVRRPQPFKKDSFDLNLIKQKRPMSSFCREVKALQTQY